MTSEVKRIARGELTARIGIGLILTCVGLCSILTIADPLGIASVLLMAVFSLIGLCAAAPEEKMDFPSLMLGAAIPVLNLFGSGALLAFCCFYLFLVNWRTRLALAWCFPWLVILGGWACSETINALDGVQLGFALSGMEEVGGSLAMLRQTPPLWLVSFLQFGRWTTLLLLVGLVTEFQNLRKRIISGLMFGLLFSVLYCLIQFLRGEHSHLIAQEPFWASQGRYAASFSDPNAFGLAAFLMIGLLSAFREQCNKRIARVAVTGLVALFVLQAFLLSGSRTLVLGLLVLGAVTIPPIRRHWAFATVVLLLLICLWRAVPYTYLDPVISRMPQSIERAARGVHPETASQTLSSRSLFLRIGLAIWKEHPIFGVGLARFRQHVPEAAERLQIPLDGWIDNANNFYLGLAAELGILGVVAFGWMLFRVGIERGADNRSSLRALVIFLFLLCTGPHLDFDEIALLFALLLAQAGVYVPLQVQWRPQLAFGALVLPALIVVHQRDNFGLYERERGAEGAYYWTGRRAAFRATCNPQGRYILKFQSLDPRNGSAPLRMQLDINGESQTIYLSDNGTHETEYLCPPKSLLGQYVSPSVEISLSRTFTPAAFGAGNDYRQLGVRLFGPSL